MAFLDYEHDHEYEQESERFVGQAHRLPLAAPRSGRWIGSAARDSERIREQAAAVRWTRRRAPLHDYSPAYFRAIGPT